MKNLKSSSVCTVVFAASMISMSSSLVQAAECDFKKPIGVCTGTIKVGKTAGSKKSFTTTLYVKSSAGACSKVEYFVDSTPYQTVLNNSNSDTESVFGTKPTIKSDVEVEKCTAYAIKGKDVVGEETSTSGQQSFAGHWTGSLRWMIVSSPATVDIAVQGSSARGTWVDGKSHVTTNFSTTIRSNRLSFSFTDQSGAPSQGVIVFQSNNAATFKVSGSGIEFVGKLRKE
ncbi:hypothetical protein LB559_06415 [Mesorhizobium sp. BR1-1-3]|uniref:hypothetical protein n=1 Tax=unclassified Mesorhizobium TaxID=325217 RepID=UPI000F75B393|nr:MULTISPECIES: hypothetical protein [unclassified Mesorhizobium]AZO45291.1 hypothetical protein EJ076_31425 [Mesorhizobium sp. M7D.F.Ca.US.005.01.1.1]MBZ9887572.1 hypothetical protein [Mesorhizobium sp. BR1-1-3]